jgi:hypothetical protein
MSFTNASTDAMIKSFPKFTLPIVSAEGTHQELATMRSALKENYCSVSTTLGGGAYGYLGGLTNDPVYTTIVPVNPFIVPSDPGNPPIIAVGTTAVAAANENSQYTERKRMYTEWQTMESSGRKQLQDSVPKGLLSGIKCAHRGFSHLRVRQMLEYLFTNAIISAEMIVENKNQLNKPWGAHKPFHSLIDRVSICREFAADAGRTITDNDVMDALFTVIFDTALMHEECEKWEDKPVANKTWHNFQAHFLKAQRKLKRRQRTTTKQGEFHCVNAIVNEHMEHANDALVNLMTNAASDRDESRLLNKTVHTQNEMIAAFTKTLASINAQIAKLSGTKAAPPPAVAPEDVLKDFMWTNGKHKWDSGRYCWTHGFIVGRNHTSASCGGTGKCNRAPGHQDTATRENRMGGSECGAPK